MAATITFPIEVSSPEIIPPATPTPSETLYLSNIDDQTGLRNHIPFVHFYPPNAGVQGRDPAEAVKEALSKALVRYYPVAGRLRHAENGKLVVDCNAGGVVFRRASAGVELAELRAAEGGLRPGFPQWDRLLVDDVWGSNFITDSPLLRVQVTRLACGGFVLAYTFNHCICDAYGAYMFMQTTSHLCRNPTRPDPESPPAWGRELLKPRSPPTPSRPHPEYDTPRKHANFTESDFRALAQTSAFLSAADVARLKSRIPGGRVPTFDAVAACLWRARTRTLIGPGSAARLLFPIDTRSRYRPELPRGYYGSAVVFPCVVAEAAEVARSPLSRVAALIAGAKRAAAGDEYRASVLDFIEANGRRGFCSDEAFVVSDMTRLNFAGVDFGWGAAVFAGPARAGTGSVPGMVTSVITHKDERGVEGVLAMVSLPRESVERFHREIRREIDSSVVEDDHLVSAL